MSDNASQEPIDEKFASEIEEHEANQPEETFDERMVELMTTIKDKVPSECDAVIIIKPHDGDTPIVFTQGHPFDTTALGAHFTRQMKQQLLAELDTEN